LNGSSFLDASVNLITSFDGRFVTPKAMPKIVRFLELNKVFNAKSLNEYFDPGLNLELIDWKYLLGQLKNCEVQEIIYKYIYSETVQKECKDIKVLYDYARFLSEYSYSNPNNAGEYFHHIAELQVILNNNLNDWYQKPLAERGDPLPPYISQQTTAQLQYFVSQNEGSININIENRDMIANIVGNRDDSTFEITNKTISPHYGFVDAELIIKGKQENIFAIRDWESRRFVEIWKTDYNLLDNDLEQLIKENGETIKNCSDKKETEILNKKRNKLFEIYKEQIRIGSTKVKLIGVTHGFDNVLYMTENNQIIKICLYRSRTETLMNEAYSVYSQLDEDVERYLKENKPYTEGEKLQKPELARLSLINTPQGMFNWLLGDSICPGIRVSANAFFEDFNSIQDDSENWKKLITLVASSKDMIVNAVGEQLYNTIKWRIEQIVANNTKEYLENKSFYTILNSNDKDIFYKICAVAYEYGVFSGDNLNNSHTSIFSDAMEIIKSMQSTESQKPSLLVFHNEIDSTAYSLDQNENELKPVFLGQKLKEYSPELYSRIRLQYLHGVKISVDNRIIETKEDFESYNFTFGQNIRFVKSMEMK
jgi:hypothetical protein